MRCILLQKLTDIHTLLYVAVLNDSLPSMQICAGLQRISLPRDTHHVVSSHD